MTPGLSGPRPSVTSNPGAGSQSPPWVPWSGVMDDISSRMILHCGEAVWPGYHCNHSSAKLIAWKASCSDSQKTATNDSHKTATIIFTTLLPAKRLNMISSLFGKNILSPILINLVEKFSALSQHYSKPPIYTSHLHHLQTLEVPQLAALSKVAPPKESSGGNHPRDTVRHLLLTPMTKMPKKSVTSPDPPEKPSTTTRTVMCS